ncbi:hypothetical protein [Peribacillus sp. JNUCC41]|uniref:hypothetical protein n=1 Tax=Peribacillus sp. JNUCC41 TaxID=2778370 RepID=UPI0017873CE8|nr:hypothetical protein [Brevibacillus sp. JNUCC-41]QOS89232.1 hypothetical protein JNUCC41_21095 [Brevibacillus sp. JNUCC-41]
MDKDILFDKLKEFPGNTRVFGGLTEIQIDKTLKSANDLHDEQRIVLKEAAKEDSQSVRITAVIKEGSSS